jgi:hypothetical protein
VLVVVVGYSVILIVVVVAVASVRHLVIMERFETERKIKNSQV